MKTCKTCKHWNRKTGVNSRGAVYWRREGFGSCNKIKDVEESSIDDDNGLKIIAVACDGRPMRAWIETAPTFGCVLQEENVAASDNE